MVTIKLGIYEIMGGINDWINKILGSNVCLFNNNYSEFYIRPKQTELYVKVKKGKKSYYKKLDYFFSTEYYNSDLSICLENHEHIDEKVEFDCEVVIEQDYNKENK